MHKAELNRSNRKPYTASAISPAFTSALSCLLPLSPSRLGRRGAGDEDARFVEVSVRTPLYVGYKFGTAG